MILAKFRHKYPQGSLVSELIKIDRGTYIVKASVRVDSIVLATGLAGAATVEAAEDAARARAIATLSLDVDESVNTGVEAERRNAPAPSIESFALSKGCNASQSVRKDLPHSGLPEVSSAFPPVNTARTTSVQTEPIATPVTSSASPKVSAQPNVNFSKSQPQPQQVSQEQPLTPVTVPLKPVVETTESNPEPEANQAVDSEPAPTNSLFGDTFTAQTPIEPVIEDSSDSISEEQEAMDFNEIKQKTDIEIRRLNWTKDKGREFLMSRYGKKSRLHLKDEQLLEFLRYLETLPNPVK